MTISIYINITDIEDAITLNNMDIVEVLFENAENLFREGGQLIIQREYKEGTPDGLKEGTPEVLAVFKTLDQISTWKEKVLKIRDKIK